jgi:hypothetical protein
MHNNPLIAKIPVELLAKIFHHCLPAADEPVLEEDGMESGKDGSEAESDGLALFIRPSRKTAPLLLTEVSRSWRETAMGSTELWCSLRVDFHDHEKHPSVASKMGAWLARSGTERGLCIALRVCGFVGGRDADRYANEALAVLLWYMHRWENVALYWGQNTAPNLTPGLFRAMNMDASPVPLLKELQIDSFISIIDVNRHMEDQLSILLRTAPRLTSFAWFDNMVLRGTFWRPLHLNPALLQELRLGCVVSVDECVTMMCNSPQLQACEFTLVIIDTSPANRVINPVIPTNFLYLIYFKICSLRNLGPLFDSITVPALRSLAIEGIDEDTSLLLPRLAELEFVSLLERSKCPLEELILDANMSANCLFQALQRVDDSLRTLHIVQNGQGCVTDVVLASLTPRVKNDGTVQCLCPKIDRICLTGSTTVILSPGVLPGMLESRIENNREIYIYVAYRRSHLRWYDRGRLQDMAAHHSRVTIELFD